MHDPLFSSAAYWDTRYRHGGSSGAGSAGRLARFKAEFINGFVQDNAITSIIDMGCGDGGQLALLHVPEDYVGIDVSPTVLDRCRITFPHRRFISFDQRDELVPADLVLSLDVIYHLVEDAAFTETIHSTFALARRFVLIYSSNFEATWPSPHVRHRAFVRSVIQTQPEWRLLAHVPNKYPFDPQRQDDTSFADFFVFGRQHGACTLHIPGGD